MSTDKILAIGTVAVLVLGFLAMGMIETVKALRPAPPCVCPDGGR